MEIISPEQAVTELARYCSDDPLYLMGGRSERKLRSFVRYLHDLKENVYMYVSLSSFIVNYIREGIVPLTGSYDCINKDLRLKGNKYGNVNFRKINKFV